MAIAEEVKKLLAAGFIRKIDYPNWISNVVMVKKANEVLQKSFEWNDECEVAFKNLKEYLASPPLLSRAEPGEPLYVYLASTATTVSSVLIREDKKLQRPVYCTSRIPQGAETRYPRIEKLAFALITSARRLRPYYQAHPIKFTEEIEESNEDSSEPIWFIEVDGSSSSESSGAGIIIKTPDGVTI
ncbi:uncharacterized protein LOC132185270 [Corylus avellana]|uniref:uncharacterized protein LOC132185270 n=1 Tax=Corylus avellana TaxID=13451 RepID=UPI00286A3556|nr:uncharacterized protein LOC132185270 [Corylus avellana]